MAREFTGTKTRVEYWERVFQRLQYCFSTLEQRQDSFLAVSFAYLLERALAELRLPQSGALVATPLSVGNESDSLGSGLAWSATRPATLPRTADALDQDGLQVLLLAAESVLEDGAQYDFSDLDLDEAALLREFRALSSFRADRIEEVQLLPPRFLKLWLGMIEVLGRMDDPLARMRLEASLLKVVRGVYALALGSVRMGRGTDDLRRDLLLAHTMGQGLLQERATV